MSIPIVCSFSLGKLLGLFVSNRLWLKKRLFYVEKFSEKIYRPIFNENFPKASPSTLYSENFSDPAHCLSFG